MQLQTSPPRRPSYRVEATQSGGKLNLKELWNYRELAYFLVWREIKVRYKQTVLGIAWAILKPVMTMVVFSVIFGVFAKLPSDGVPYPVFSYCALLPWMLFSQSLTATTGSLGSNRDMIEKIYFPRLILPITSVLSSLFDFFIAFTVLLGMMLFYGIVPTWAVVTLPLLLLLAVTTSFSVGVWLGALSVKYRDFRQVVAFLVQIWLYATPVAYSISLVPEKYQLIYGLNPLVGVVEGFRWALLGKATVPSELLVVSVVVVLLLLVSGVKYFRRMERTFADVI